MSTSQPARHQLLSRRLEVTGPFDLARTAAFSFGPKDAVAFDGAYRMAFVLDGYRGSAAVAVRQPSAGTLTLEVSCAGDVEADAAAVQTARSLSVDVDARGFVALAERDDVLRPLVAAAPGLRPPLFPSAYEALAWSVLSARRPRAQMVTVRDRLSEAAGQTFVLDGQQLAAFPEPAALLEVDEFPGLSEEKVRRLHGVARSALAGRLDTGSLRRMPVDEAAATVRSHDGIGPFYAELTTVRALGHTDVLPTNEPRVRARLAELLGRSEPVDQSELVSLAEHWRPWRTWACVHIRAVPPDARAVGPRSVAERV